LRPRVLDDVALFGGEGDHATGPAAPVHLVQHGLDAVGDGRVHTGGGVLLIDDQQDHRGIGGRDVGASLAGDGTLVHDRVDPGQDAQRFVLLADAGGLVQVRTPQTGDHSLAKVDGDGQHVAAFGGLLDDVRESV